MLEIIGSSIDLVIQFITLSMCRRYVFLEKGLEGKKQRYFNLYSLLFLFLCNIVLGNNIAQVCLVVLIGLNISLARKKHKITGCFLTLPITGIVNGIIVPIFLLASGIFGLKENDYRYPFLAYGVICLFGIWFYAKGKNWRYQFETQMGDRTLQKWETILLYFVGILMMFFSNIIGYSIVLVQENAKSLAKENVISDLVGQFVSNLFFIGMDSFVLSITIIVLIMQGNKRAYYYERAQKLSLQMVHALANTIDAKDSYTNGHSTRVAKYSVMLAKRMGYKGEALQQLQYAALLHDIGKIGIPVEIINKPSKLTDEEYEIIKTHPVIGANILKEITEIPDISIGARYHHERYDGKGYPDKKNQQEIPKIARIIGVADAYDAMTSKRSYRDVLPQEVVRKEIEKGMGSQFDPEIAKVMLALIDEDVNYEMHE